MANAGISFAVLSLWFVVGGESAASQKLNAQLNKKQYQHLRN